MSLIKGSLALPVYEALEGQPTLGQPAVPVYEVTEGELAEFGMAPIPVVLVAADSGVPLMGGAAQPIVIKPATGLITGGPATPVYLIGGGPAPVTNPYELPSFRWYMALDDNTYSNILGGAAPCYQAAGDHIETDGILNLGMTHDFIAGRFVSDVISEYYEPAQGAFTLNFWMRLDQAHTAISEKLYIWGEAGRDSVAVKIETTASGEFRWYDTGGWFDLTTPAVAVGSWHLFTITNDGGTLNLYFDGAAISAPVTIGPSWVMPSMDQVFEFYLGNAGYRNTFDEMAYWSAVLTSGQVSMLWNLGVGSFYRP